MNGPNDILAGKVAVITGAGRGIGKAIALAYADAGAAISCAARTAAEIQDTEKAIIQSGGRALAVPADVTRVDSVNSLFKTTADFFGSIDILVINAGAIYDRRTVEESSIDDWKRTLEVNLTGAYLCARAAVPYLKQRGGGKIITIGSGLGHRGNAGRSAYACSKAGLWMLTRVLAQELWEYNISVNELIPGPVETSMDAAASKKGTVFVISSEWIKTPEDVIPLALFLASQPAVGPTAQSFSLMRRDN